MNEVLGGINVAQCGQPVREKAQTIAASEFKRLNDRALAWGYLSTVMDQLPPSDVQEAALWDLLCSVRRERY